MVVSGEYWISDDGEVLVADGDENHQTIVAAHALERVCELMDRVPNAALRYLSQHLQHSLYPGDVTYVRGLVNDTTDDMQRRGYLTDSQADDPYAWIRDTANVPADLLRIATATDDSRGTDSRDYATQFWGWTAVRQDRLVTRGIRERKLRVIAQGLERILEDEGLLTADPEFILEDQATGRVYHVRCDDLHVDLNRLFQRHSRLTNL